ncbi:MAG: urate hydroxylase PuuD, partial [Rhodoferax sp.]|nr:urate hydroxylase PuuD [Rhodoferax sp.]
GQRTVVADIKAGRAVDPIHGKRGKQRSVHNTYFTLPVLFAMLSGHYSFTYTHPQNWIVLVLMMFAGAAIRQFFVLRHGFKLGRNGHPWPYALAGVVAIMGVMVWLKPAPVVDSGAITSGAVNAASTGAGGPIAYKTVQAVLEQRCHLCHGAQVQMKNVRLDSPEGVKLHAQNIYQQAVVTKVMPLNNATGITEVERALIKQWFEGGAAVN